MNCEENERLSAELAKLRAGAEAVRAACVRICEEIEEAANAKYKGRLPGQDRRTAYDPHDLGRSVGAAECAAAICALDLSRIGGQDE